jgi:multiple sugar transport system permease protein
MAIAEAERVMKTLRTRIISISEHSLLILLGAFVGLPFLWMITTSLKPPKLAFAAPYLLPTHFYWQNYTNAWADAPFARYYLNSLIVALGITVGQIVTSVLAAFAFDRFEFPFKKTLWLMLLSTLMIPLPLLVIPTFQLVQKLGWANSLVALVVPRLWTAFGILLLRQYFKSIPRELDDAARIDGAGTIQLITKVIVPLAKPAIATVGLFAFLFAWNDFLWPLIVLNSPENFTVPLGVANFTGKYGTRWTMLMAATVTATLPAVIGFLLLQKSLIRGLTTGGVNE